MRPVTVFAAAGEGFTSLFVRPELIFLGGLVPNPGHESCLAPGEPAAVSQPDALRARAL